MHSSRMHSARSSSHLLEGVSASVHAGIHTPPGVGLETIPRVWALRPPSWVWDCRSPKARPLNFPPGCGPGYLQGMLGYNPPTVNRMTDRHAYKQNLRKLRLRAVIKYNITRTFEKVPSCASDKLVMSLTDTFQSPPNYNEIPKMFQ